MEQLFAYLDPGTGSVILQAIIGGLLGSIFVLRSKIMQLGHAVRRLLGKKDPAEKTSSATTSKDS